MSNNLNNNQLIEVDPNKVAFDEIIEPIFGSVNLSEHPDLAESFKEEGPLGTIPLVREVKGVLVCFAHRKFVEYAKQAGLKTILVQRLDGDNVITALRSVKTNVTKHSDKTLAKAVTHLFTILSDGKGARNDKKKENLAKSNGEPNVIITDPDEDTKEVNADNSKKKRNPTVYDKIGPLLGISPKKAQMLKVVYEKVPAYFDRMERSRSSLYEAYSKVNEEIEGFEPKAPTEKPAVDTTDTTGVPKFSPGDPTYNVNAVYEFVENATGENTPDSAGGKKKMVVKTKVIYVTQEVTCPHCGRPFSIVVPKTATDEQ